MNEKKSKMKLEDLKVESFVTALDKKDTEKLMAGCPNTTLPTQNTSVPLCAPTGCCPPKTGLITCVDD